LLPNSPRNMNIKNGNAKIICDILANASIPD
jgi:hypothetical protein